MLILGQTYGLVNQTVAQEQQTDLNICICISIVNCIPPNSHPHIHQIIQVLIEIQLQFYKTYSQLLTITLVLGVLF